MLIPEPPIDKYAPITEQEARAALSTGAFGDDPALKMVVQDAMTAENFEQQKQWILAWSQASTLYQSPYAPRYWEGTMVERANVPMFTVATAVNSLTPQVVNGLFYDNPPFMAQPRPGTKSESARAVGALMGFQLEDIKFKEELRLGINNAVLFGTGIWKYGWETYERIRKVFKRKNPPTTVVNPLSDAGAPDITIFEEEEEVEVEEITEYVDRPRFEHIVNLRQVLVDPGLSTPDLQRAKYVIHRLYLTWEELSQLRGREGFEIPSEAEMMLWFLPPVETPEASSTESSPNNSLWDAKAAPRYDSTTINPLQQPLEVLEYWTNDRVIMVLQKKVVICNEVNPYGRKPFFSVNWWDIPESFWGMGLAKTIGAEQRIQQGITNTWLDNAALNLNGVYVRVRSKNIPTQSIRISPGKIVEVDEKDGFKPIDRLDPVPEAGTHIQMSMARAEKISGANEPATQGIAGPTGHSNLARSAAGANLIASGSGNRIADFVEKVCNNVVIPFLYELHEMNREMLPLKTIREILGNELSDAYLKPEREGGAGGDPIDILNARVRFEMLAGAKMQARRSMAQSLPILTQYLMSPELTEQLSIQGKKIDINEVINMFFVVSDWKNQKDVVVEMTPDDKKRFEQMKMGPEMLRAQQASAMEQQKFQNKAALADNENYARAARDVLKQRMESEMEAPGGTGGPAFGARV